MKKNILISSTLNEVRIAITEDNKLAELLVEMPDKARSIGNIYLGRVRRIIQSMNAAFIDIGTEQDAFLHFSDVAESMEENFLVEEDEENDDQQEVAEDDKISQSGEDSPPQQNESLQDGKKNRRGKRGGKNRRKDDGRERQGQPLENISQENTPEENFSLNKDQAAEEFPLLSEGGHQERNTPEFQAQKKKNRRGKRGGRNRNLRRDENSPHENNENNPEQNFSSEERSAVTSSQERENFSSEDPVTEGKNHQRNRHNRGRNQVHNQRNEADGTNSEQNFSASVPVENIRERKISEQNAQEQSPHQPLPGKNRPETRKPRPEKRTREILPPDTTIRENIAPVHSEENFDQKKKSTRGAGRKKNQPRIEVIEERIISSDKNSPQEKENFSAHESQTQNPEREKNSSENPEQSTQKKRGRYPRRKNPGGKNFDVQSLARYDNKPAENTAKLPTFWTKRSGEVTINLEEGQNIVVQVVREAYHQKGVRVTTKVGLPGRYVVLLPYENAIGISRKISSFKERRRLRQIAKSKLPAGAGCIIRTASQDQSEAELVRDFENLRDKWDRVEERIKEANGEPALVYQDMSLANTVMRDLFTKDVERVVVDSKKLFRELREYLEYNAPHLADKIEFYNGNRPLYEAMNIQQDLEQTYNRKVQLPSGGSIVIDPTEAMIVIDVNSGRSSGDKGQESNAFKTNMEAVKEIARQIRLRDFGGMVLVDFIDLGDDRNRAKVFHAMKNELARDRAKTTVYPLTQLGILQITRQRINQNITEKLSEACPACNGTGRIMAKSVILQEIESWLGRFKAKAKDFRLRLVVHPDIAEYLGEGTFSKITRLMLKYFVKIKLQPNDTMPIDEFKFYSVKQQRDITQEFA